jgi:spore coat protein U-like protein
MKLRHSFALAASLSAAIAWASTAAFANTATASLSVSATVTNNCTISTTALAFGSYDPIVAHASSNLDGTGTVVIACTKGAGALIGLDSGLNAEVSTRRLKNGTVYLAYEVYKESGRTNVWGNAGVDLNDAGAAPSSAAQTFTVYGRVSSGQTSAIAGTYTDTLTATVNF